MLWDNAPYGHFYQASRAISTGQLHTLLHFHLRPINPVVFQGPSVQPEDWMGNLISGRVSRLDAFSGYLFASRIPSNAPGGTTGTPWMLRSGPLVLGTAPLKFPTPTTDRDRTVSRRSEPSSRTALIGEQPNPWDLLQPQDAMSRHRGAKPSRRCEPLGEDKPVIPGVPFIR